MRALSWMQSEGKLLMPLMNAILEYVGVLLPDSGTPKTDVEILQRLPLLSLVNLHCVMAFVNVHLSWRMSTSKLVESVCQASRINLSYLQILLRPDTSHFFPRLALFPSCSAGAGWSR